MHLKSLILGCVFLVPIGCLASDNPAPGFVEGHLKILASKDVELAEGNPSKFSDGNYAEYPLIILSQDGKKEIARITADENGNYRLVLPPGHYILDVQGRLPKGHVRAKPQRFTITSNQTAHVDMDIDTGIR
ncbi:MAG TPA: carboxypeptidase-like regulatory domain-containing protein [Candidatus Udaeobacter sp.]|nr:carboxypeptidase-like regulatory domain-containing protein [Candidatus Udaeobacter sp.]